MYPSGESPVFECFAAVAIGGTAGSCINEYPRPNQRVREFNNQAGGPAKQFSSWPTCSSLPCGVVTQ